MQKIFILCICKCLAWKPGNVGVANENVKKQSSVYMT